MSQLGVPEERTSAEAPVWLREQSEGNDRVRLGRRGGDLVAEWEGLGALRASADGSSVELRSSPGLEPARAKKWREGAVEALLRHLRGRATLHASAVGLGERGVVFLGASGAGKSTCAADLCLRLGADLLADDLAQIDVSGEGYVVRPSEAAHWLLSDSSAAVGHPRVDERKLPLAARSVSADSIPLTAILCLSYGDGPVALTRIRGQAAFAAINAVYVRFVVDDPLVQLRDLDAMARLVAAVPIYALVRPRSFAALSDVANVVARVAASSLELAGEVES